MKRDQLLFLRLQALRSGENLADLSHLVAFDGALNDFRRRLVQIGVARVANRVRHGSRPTAGQDLRSRCRCIVWIRDGLALEREVAPRVPVLVPARVLPDEHGVVPLRLFLQ